MSIAKAFDIAFRRMKEKKWDKIYVLIDVHDTILKGTYSKDETFEWLTGAREALVSLTNAKDICLILWTASHQDKINEYLKFFKNNDIYFDYVNCNPEVINDDLGNFELATNGKLYFNIGIDDKFGFSPEDGDWYIIKDIIDKHNNF